MTWNLPSPLRAGLIGLLALLATWRTPEAHAAVPPALAVQGVLRSAGGQPAPDGDYGLTFQLYAAQTGGTAVWKDGPLMVAVQGGQFALTLGQNQPLSAAMLAGLSQAWLGITVGTGDELPRRPLQSVAFSLRASVAEGVDCSGCIGVGQLDPAVLQPYAKSADLAPLAKSADLAAYAKLEDLNAYAKIATLAAVAGSGSYSDLVGKPVLAPVATSGVYQDLEGLPKLAKVGTACGSGLVVRGILGDGSLDCVSAAITAANLPSDGLAKVSNGLLLNQFSEVTVSGKTPLDLADKALTSDAINVADYGAVGGLSVSVDLANSDISKLRLVLKDPQGASYTLYDQGGSGAALKTSWPTPSAPIAGDLGLWQGANPKGVWTLEVIDLAGVEGKTDGKLNSWSIAVTALSTKKVAVTGALQFFGAAQPPVPCNASHFGASYANTVDKALYFCNGSDWFPFFTSLPGSKDNPALSCKDLLAKAPATKDGAYWINPDATTPYQVWCDMTSDGGGWTLAMRFKADGKLGYGSALWTNKTLFNDDGTGSVVPTLDVNAKLGSFNNVVGTTVRGCKGAAGPCVSQSMGGNKTLSTLFGENFKNGGQSRGTFTSIWGDDGSQPHCNVAGINNGPGYGGAGSYSGARLGLVGNNENDCNTTDSAWGVGVYGCSDTAAKSCGSGAAFWQNGSCGLSCAQGTLWVR
jgi:subtilisin-like proprotein convertase family protein